MKTTIKKSKTVNKKAIKKEVTISDKYLAFLLNLWQLSKDDAEIKAISPLIKKYGISSAVSKVLIDNNYIFKEDGVYVWNGNKPSMKTVNEIKDLIKSYNDSI